MSNDRRTAIVTGAARGIGAAVATRLAADGHAVAVVDLDEQTCKSVVAKIEDDGGTALAVAADVSDEQSVADATAAVADQLGGPTILVNNAGITRDNVLRKMSVDDWDAVAAVHLRGNFLFSRAAQPHMREAGWGRIVNLSSVSALGNLGQANCAAAKAGVQGITKTLAIELGRDGVTVNAVAPGFIETEMTAATAERMGVSFESSRNQPPPTSRSAALASRAISPPQSRFSLRRKHHSCQVRFSSSREVPAADLQFTPDNVRHSIERNQTCRIYFQSAARRPSSLVERAESDT